MNIEGLKEWDIKQPERTPGLSAIVRIKNEAEYILPSLESIAFCDEIIICIQGKQSDNTAKLVEGFENVHEYPFDSLPNGPGHDEQPKNSVYERAYFYNWCIGKTTRSHILKWDGDMVAHDWLGGKLLKMLGKNYIKFGGTDIGKNLMWIRDFTSNSPRVFPSSAQYYSGRFCEQLDSGPGVTIHEPAYLHFKWSKSMKSITSAWPKGWKKMPHFQNIVKRATPVNPYDGPMPKCLSLTT